MNRFEVGRILDPIAPVVSFHPSFESGWFNEDRSLDLPTCAYEHDSLGFVGTSAQVPDVFFEGINVYDELPRDVLITFERANGGAEVFGDIVLFRQIAIDVTSFYDAETQSYADGDGNMLRRRTVAVNRSFVAENPPLPYKPVTFIK